MPFLFFKKKEKGLKGLNLIAALSPLAEVQTYLQNLAKKNPQQLALELKIACDSGGYPLDYAFVNTKASDYSVADLLLQYGADPFARSPGPDEKGYSQLHSAIHERNLGKLRLLLWYNPDYEGVLDPEAKVTAKEALEQWAEAEGFFVMHQERFWSIVEIVSFTITISKRVAQIKTDVEVALACHDYASALEDCRLLQAIYLNQAILEKHIPYPSARVAKDPCIEKKKAYMIQYYQNKAKYYENYQETIKKRASGYAARAISDVAGHGANPLLSLEL